MRFHIGFSKRIKVKTLIQLLGFLFVVALAYFGLTQHAFAETNGNVSMIPNAMYFHTNSSGADVSPTSFGSKTCSFDSSKTCFYMYGFNVNAFSPQDFNFIYNSKNLCSNNNNLSTITFRGIMQSPAGTNVRGNLQAYESNSSLANVSMEFQSNNVFTITVKYDTSKQLRLRFNSSLSDSSIYYMELTNSNYYTCDYTIQDSTQDITNNANQNTENIINNNNQNTQDIIDNQNQNTQDIIDSNKENFQTCRDSYNLFNLNLIESNSFVTKNNTGFTMTRTADSRFTPYYSVNLPAGSYKLMGTITGNYNDLPGVQYRDSNGTVTTAKLTDTVTFTNTITSIRFYLGGGTTVGNYLTFSDFMLVNTSHIPSSYEAYGVEVCSNKLDDVNSSVNGLNDSITDDNISGASSTGNGFFDNFSINDQLGLASIASAPIRLFQTLVNSNNSCLPLTLNLDLGSNYQKTVTVPGGCLLWDNVPSAVEALYFAVVFGLFGYRILIDMYHFLSSLRDPDKKNEFTLDL